MNNEMEIREMKELIKDYEIAKEHLTLRLFHKNSEKAKKADIYFNVELITDEIDDLVAIPYVEKEFVEDTVRIRVTNEVINMWRVINPTKEIDGMEIFFKARENEKKKKYKIIPLPEYIMKISGIGYLGLGLYIMVHEHNTSEAAHPFSIISHKQQIKEKFPDGYAIIPSSTEECIIVDTNVTNDMETIETMIKEINVEEVKPEEILGVKPYVFK